MDFISSLLSAGANLLGGMFNRSSAQDIANQNIQNQLAFAQHGISWRVADAKAAGINPLAALGAQTNSFSNVVGDTGLGAGVAAAGQDLGRAAQALSSEKMKGAELELRAKELQVKALEQDVIAKQMDNAKVAVHLNQPGTGPGVPMVNVPLPPPSPFTKDTLPLFQRYRTGRGEIITLPSKDASQALQNMASAPGGAVVAAALMRELGPNWQQAADPWMGQVTSSVRNAVRQWMTDIANGYGY